MLLVVPNLDKAIDYKALHETLLEMLCLARSQLMLLACLEAMVLFNLSKRTLHKMQLQVKWHADKL